MRVKFHGPLDRVTGSCTELYDPVHDVRLLVDCGMKQGEGATPEANAAPFPFDPASLRDVFLTHAHIDHCGLVPRLYREGFTGTVYCTRETADLARLVLVDAARLGAPYSEADVSRIRFHEPGKAVFGAPCPVGKDLFVTFHRTGHLLGATSITVLSGPPRTSLQRSITFSGDLGPFGEGEGGGLIRFRMTPFPADVCVVESTYGAVARPPSLSDPEQRLARFAALLDEGLLERRGVVVIPTFALGRTQDVLLDLHALWSRDPGRYAEVKVYLDAPLGQRANLVYAGAMGRMYETANGKRRPAWLSKSLFGLFGLDPGDAADEALLLDCVQEMLSPSHAPRIARRGALAHWRRLPSPPPAEVQAVRGPAVVVTGGGMCEGGRVQEWLRAGLGNDSTTVLLAGFCAPGTIGGYLTALARTPERGSATLHEALAKEPLRYAGPVRARIDALQGYSAHADQAGLLSWLFEVLPDGSTRQAGRKVVIQHGNVGSRRALASAIEARAAALGISIGVELPTEHHGWFDLSTGAWDVEGLTTEQLLRARVADLERRLAIQTGTGSPLAPT